MLLTIDYEETTTITRNDDNAAICGERRSC